MCVSTSASSWRVSCCITEAASAPLLVLFLLRSVVISIEIDTAKGIVQAIMIYENGKLVAGESIADLGGVTIAYKAFQKSL